MKSNNKIFFDELRTIIIPVKVNRGLLKSLSFYSEHINLIQKNEFHVTILGINIGEMIIRRKIPFDNIKQIYYQNKLMIKPLNKFFIVKKKFYKNKKVVETRTSIIQKVEVKDVKKLYQDLSNLLKIKLKVPYMHITLYTNSSNPDHKMSSFGIYSDDQFNRNIIKEIKPKK